MKTSTSLPVRTTLLHVLYPDTVPIFDQMVLKAVGSWYATANQDIAVLGRSSRTLGCLLTDTRYILQASKKRLFGWSTWVCGLYEVSAINFFWKIVADGTCPKGRKLGHEAPGIYS